MEFPGRYLILILSGLSTKCQYRASSLAAIHGRSAADAAFERPFSPNASFSPLFDERQCRPFVFRLARRRICHAVRISLIRAFTQQDRIVKTALRGAVLALVLACGFVGSAFARSVTFTIQWSGQYFSNAASATGFITFDDALLPSVGVSDYVPLAPAVSGFGLTVTGAQTGNGTFDMSHFDAILFATPSPLDLGTELIGQALAGTEGCTFGPNASESSPCGAGAFVLVPGTAGLTAGAPYPVLPFVVWAGAGQGDPMMLMSMAPVPEPETCAMLLAGLGLLVFAARSRRQEAVATAPRCTQ
jgi:hypothetical protein